MQQYIDYNEDPKILEAARYRQSVIVVLLEYAQPLKLLLHNEMITKFSAMHNLIGIDSYGSEEKLMRINREIEFKDFVWHDLSPGVITFGDPYTVIKGFCDDLKR